MTIKKSADANNQTASISQITLTDPDTVFEILEELGDQVTVYYVGGFLAIYGIGYTDK